MEQLLPLLIFLVLAVVLNLLARRARWTPSEEPEAASAPGPRPRPRPAEAPRPGLSAPAPPARPPVPPPVPPSRPARRAPRQRPGRRLALTRGDARQAVLLMAVLGPCRATAPGSSAPDAPPAVRTTSPPASG
jgi:hypothetical protein